jgi:hypothetical protein
VTDSREAACCPPLRTHWRDYCRVNRPPERYLIPIATLGVPDRWSVGSTVFHPGDRARELIAGTPPADSPDGFIETTVHNILDAAVHGSIAEVSTADDFNQALDAVRAGMSALRLFKLSRATFRETTFGLPGEIEASVIEYVAVWDRAAFGASRRGSATGWTFDQQALDDWNASSAFQYLSTAIRDPTADDGSRRAVRGALLLDRAALEHRPDLKMLGFASALEAWLLQRSAGPQTLRLARHVSWFGCGAHDNNLCGRARPICPYLHLSPDGKHDRKRLDTLRVLGNTYPAWRCSEWHRVMDWYDARSDAAHGRPDAVDPKHAREAEFWISHYLLEPILLWLRDHHDDPVSDLEELLDANADPANWAAMLQAIDAPAPAPMPPLSNGGREPRSTTRGSPALYRRPAQRNS